jgi:Secretion system C-terminal sorting domain
MKSLLKQLILLAFLCTAVYGNLFAQVASDSAIRGASIGGFFDQVFDNSGKAYALRKYQLPNAQGYIPTNPSAKQSSVLACNSGYFTLWFEQDWQGLLSPADAALAQSTICQIFQDVSNLLQRPNGPTDNIQIWIRDPTQLGFTNSSSGLAYASSFIYAPPTSSGIADNVTFLTLNGGKDAWINVASPLTSFATNNAASGTYFHGQASFNFLNSAINWHLTSATATVPSTKYDLYSGGLHEVLHMLGFFSQIFHDGNSIFGTSYQYYNRYDQQLINGTGTSLIISPSTSCNPIYNNIFNSAVPNSDIKPNGFVNLTGTAADNSVGCNGVRYSSTNIVPAIPIYVPNAFEVGSSLSHLEDECAFSLPGYSCGTACEDEWYLMSNGMHQAVAKRAPSEHERIILNNIGYKVANQYITNVGQTYSVATTYSATLVSSPAIDDGIGTIGYCDGISGGIYQYSISPGGTINIPISNLTSNDRDISGGIECPEILGSPGSSIALSGPNLSITAASTAVAGPMLIRYIPTTIASGTLQYGNITYLYVFVSGSCAGNPCGNIVPQGDFEPFTVPNYCGSTAGSSSTTLTSISTYANCWYDYCGTSDIMSRSSNCTIFSGAFKLGSINAYTQLGTSVWNPSGINDRVLGVGGQRDVTFGDWAEAAQTKLSTALIPGNWYTLRLKANAGHQLPQPLTTSYLSIMGSATALVGGSVFNTTNPGLITLSSTPNLNKIGLPFNGGWQNFSFTFQYNGATACNYLVIGNDWLTTYGTSTAPNMQSSIIVDDIEIFAGSPSITFTPPSTASCNTIITNLSQYLSAIPSSGVSFSGPNGSVYHNGSSWVFNSSLAGNGNAIVTCTYTDLNGCIINVSANIMVSNSFSFITSPLLACLPASGSLSLTASGLPFGSSINWTTTTGTSIGTTPTVTISSAGTYFAAVNSGGCTATRSVVVTSTQTMALTTTGCIPLGSTATLTATTGFTSYTFAPAPVSQTGNTATINVAGVYTVTAANAAGCTGSATVTAFAQSPLVLTGPSCLPVGSTATLTATAGMASYTFIGSTTSISGNTATTSTAGTYSVVATNANGCGNSASKIISSVAAVTLQASGCIPSGGTTTLTSTAGFTTYAYSPAVVSQTSNTAVVNTAVIYTVTATNAAGCTTTATASVAAASIFTASFATCTAGAYAQITATAGLPSYTFVPAANVTSQTANIAKVNAGGTYTVTATAGSGCILSATVAVPLTLGSPCSLSPSPPVLGGTFTTVPSNYYRINTSITLVNPTTTWTSCDIAVTSPTAKIIVPTGKTLIISNCRIHACGTSNMWEGIEVQTGGRLLIGQESLIEDALKAVNIQTTSLPNVLMVRNTTFNKNLEGIVFQNFSNAGGYPVNIGRCVFTSRNLAATGCLPPNWPTTTQLQATSTVTNTLISPYNLMNLTVVPLNNGTAKPKNHIRCTKVGRTDGTVAAPVINSIILNHTDTALMLYDNAENGIYADNSNIQVFRNNVFQYCNNGINLEKTANVANGTSALKLFGAKTWSLTGNFIENYFYDNQIAIRNVDYAFADLRNNSIRSSVNSTLTYSTSANPPVGTSTSLPIGYLGIVCVIYSNADCNIQFNELYNVHMGVWIYTGIGNALGQIMNAGKITLSNNKIWDKPAGNSTSTAYIGNAIGTGFYSFANSTFVNHLPSPVCKIESNNIKNAYRGIGHFGFDFAPQLSQILANVITLTPDPHLGTQLTQFGIWSADNRNHYIKGNEVTATAPTTTNGYLNQTYNQIFSNNSLGAKGRQINYKMANNINNTITCNKSQGGMIGFEFNGGSMAGNTRWMTLNEMNNNHYLGYLLNNGGLIGTQGSSAQPINNLWNFIPAGTGNSSHTFVFNSLATNSKLHLNGSGLPFPTVNFATTANIPYTTAAGVTQSLITNTTTPSTTCLGGPIIIAGALNDVSTLNNVVSALGIPYPAQSVELNYNNKFLVYKLQKTDSAYIAASTDLSTFYNASNAPTTQYRKMQDIEEAIGAGNYTTAQTLTNAFTTSNETEINQKAYYNIVIAYGSTGILSASNQTALLAIAVKCPYTQGPCVSSARQLYNWFTVLNRLPLYLFFDDCNSSGLYKKEQEIAEPVTASSISMYPNPAHNYFYIHFGDNAVKKANIIILDNLGRKVCELDKEIISNVIYVDKPLQAGIYYVKIIANEGIPQTKKLVIY